MERQRNCIKPWSSGELTINARALASASANYTIRGISISHKVVVGLTPGQLD